jgi:hypothetical protein
VASSEIPESVTDVQSGELVQADDLALEQHSAALPQVGSHRLSIYEEWDPFRFRHMIPTEALQVRALPSAGKHWRLPGFHFSPPPSPSPPSPSLLLLPLLLLFLPLLLFLCLLLFYIKKLGMFVYACMCYVTSWGGKRTACSSCFSPITQDSEFS